MSQGRKSLFVVLAIALLLPACAKDPADRDESETAANQAKPPPEARELLMEMATFLAGLDAFSAKIARRLRCRAGERTEDRVP